MKRVILETPYAGDVERNTAYARAALHDSLKRGEAPYASHLLYPQVLKDEDPNERRQGIEAGLIWGEAAEATVVYQDRGITPGMLKGITDAERCGRPVEYRSLPSWEYDWATHEGPPEEVMPLFHPYVRRFIWLLAAAFCVAVWLAAKGAIR